MYDVFLKVPRDDTLFYKLKSTFDTDRVFFWFKILVVKINSKCSLILFRPSTFCRHEGLINSS